MAPSPPKPWERAGGAASSSAPLSTSTTTAGAAAGGGAGGGGTTTSAISAPGNSANNSSTTTTGAPALPERPAGMSSVAATTTGAYGSTLATSPYSATATSAYSSPYSRYGTGMGTYGSTYGTGYGGYGGGYGSYGAGGMYGGMGGYGGGYGGMGGMGYGGYGGMGGAMGPYGPGMGPDGLSLTQRMEAGTAATFQILQSLVGAVGGFAQMLESTFMATHSSFFAMIGVAEQFGHLRNYLGQVLSVFALLRWCRGLVYRLVGKVPPGEGITADGFRAFEAGGGAAGGTGAGGQPPKPKISKRPLIVFFLTVIGLPWLMNRLVRLITARQDAEAARLGLPPQQFDAMGRPLPPAPPAAATPLDPSQLTFTRALFPYTPPAENADKELSFEKDEIIAILSPTREERAAQVKAEQIEGSARGQGQGTWWMGRKRDGTTGWFPSTYVRELPMNGVSGGGALGEKKEVKA